MVVAEAPPQPGTDDDTVILVDEWSFGSQSNLAELSIGQTPYDVTGIDASASEYEMLPGVTTLRHNGYFTGVGAGYLEQEIRDRLQVIDIVHTGLLLGARLMKCVGYVLPNNDAHEMGVTAPAKSVITVNALWAQGTGPRRGYRLYGGTVSTTGTQVEIDFGGAGADGGFAYLFVQQISGGGGTVQIDVESDTDAGFGDPQVEGSFEFDTVGAYEIVLSGAIGQYLRANIVDMGGASLLEFHLIVCVAGVTY